MLEIFILLFLFQVKHFVADFLLQNEYMLGKFKAEGWVLPLTCHCLVHVSFTLAIALLFNPSAALSVTILDFIVHFTMDRIKASPKMLGKFQSLTKRDHEEYNAKMKFFSKNKSPSIRKLKHTFVKEFDLRKRSNKLFWVSLGIDQKVHHLTHYVIIYLIVR